MKALLSGAKAKSKKEQSSKKSNPLRDLDFSELNVSDTPPKVKKEPQIPALSASTLDIINRLKSEMPSNSLLKQALAKPIIKSEHKMRFKHSELLSVRRELVMPAHYKSLLELQNLLDVSLNFMTKCRSQGGLFAEIKRSIEQTHGK